jgi:hypothetical protein
MSDLTVLVSPSPVPVQMPRPKSAGFGFARANRNGLVNASPLTPVMITLELAPSKLPAGPPSPTYAKDDSLLSPPINTWKRPRSTPLRPASAPPSQTSFGIEKSKRDESLSIPAPFLPIRPRAAPFGTNAKTGELLRPPPPVCESRPFQSMLFMPP